jgi:hypothetical protein
MSFVQLARDLVDALDASFGEPAGDLVADFADEAVHVEVLERGADLGKRTSGSRTGGDGRQLQLGRCAREGR